MVGWGTKKFKIMIPDFGHDDFEDGYEEDGWEAEDACQSLMERKFSDWDYPEEMEFEVQGEDGFTERVVVTVKSEPVFSAKTLTVGVKQKKM